MGCTNASAVRDSVSVVECRPKKVVFDPPNSLATLIRAMLLLRSSEQSCYAHPNSLAMEGYGKLISALESSQQSQMDKAQMANAMESLLAEAPSTEAYHIMQCQQQLVVRLAEAVTKAKTTVVEQFVDDSVCSQEVQSIAVAMADLFNLQNYGTECKHQLINSGGILTALQAMKMGSGIDMKARRSLMCMLGSFFDKAPENAKIMR